jgi:hypothetical protein
MRPFLVPSAALLLGFLVCSASLLSSILSLSLDGSAKVAGFPNFDAVLRGAAQWTACFVAGPALLSGAAGAYWIWFGDPELVDDVVLAELVVLSIGWFLASLVSSTGSGRFWRFHPAAVLDTAMTQIGRFVATSLVAAVAIARVHRDAFEGALWLGLFWFAALVSAAFSFRRLGLRHSRPAAPAAKPRPASPPAKQRGSRIALSRTPG